MNLRAKFDISISNRSRDIKGVPKFQNKVTWPLPDPFWPNFCISFVRIPGDESACQIWHFYL